MDVTNRIDPERSELRVKLEAAIERAEALCVRLQDKTVAAAKATDKAVRDYPYPALGVAFGIGVLIGVLAMRSSHE
jgi:ElaB/YqjD/DUF883 family membrane-anchored ribosome-binding protein